MEQQNENSYLKRGKGKTVGDIKKKDFFSYYRKHSSAKKRLDKLSYGRFTKDLMSTFSEAIVKDALSLKMGALGSIRIRSRKLTTVKRDGKIAKTLRVDWPATFAYWHKTYPDLTRDEIIGLKDKGIKKKCIYHLNEHTDKEFYEHWWDEFITSSVKYHKFYRFKPSRQYSRLIAQVVKDPNRKAFYYR